MPSNKKPSKKYRPRHPIGQTVLPCNIRYTPHNEMMLKIVPHQELEKLRDGTADAITWHTLTMRLDWGLFMSLEHFENQGTNEAIQAGLEALLSIKNRNEKMDRWGASGCELYAIGNALNLTDEMQTQTTRKEQHDSLKKMLSFNNKMLKEGRVGLVQM